MHTHQTSYMKSDQQDKWAERIPLEFSQIVTLISVSPALPPLLAPAIPKNSLLTVCASLGVRDQSAGSVSTCHFTHLCLNVLLWKMGMTGDYFTRSRVTDTIWAPKHLKTSSATKQALKNTQHHQTFLFRKDRCHNWELSSPCDLYCP